MKKCPKCKEDTLVFNERWDKEYDRLDPVVPAPDLIKIQLNNSGIPEYICSKCGKEVFADIH